jgi:hypothetical protein
MRLLLRKQARIATAADGSVQVRWPAAYTRAIRDSKDARQAEFEAARRQRNFGQLAAPSLARVRCTTETRV